MTPRRPLFSYCYDLLLAGVMAGVALPRLVARLRLRSRAPLREQSPPIPSIPRDRPLIWAHAVSLGETKAVSGLVKQFKAEKPTPSVIVSSITQTGHADAKRLLPEAEHHVFLPLDFSWSVNRMLQNIAPKLVLITETDLWYQFLRVTKSKGAILILVNGKLSERSAKRHAWFPWFSRRLFGLFDLLCVQNELYKERFLQIGVPASKLVVTGNMKFDDIPKKLSADELSALRLRLGLQQSDPVLVIGSSHHPEEQLFIQSLQQVWKQVPNLKVLLVPRHPERFDQVADLLAKANISYSRYSQIAQPDGPTAQVVLIDAMGVLRQCYQLADIALVAGSYTDKVGGHNILEPCWFGVPVLFGPYMHTQPELVQIVLSSKSGMQIAPENLAQTLISLLKDPSQRQQFGQAGSQLAAMLQGSTQRTFKAIESLLNSKRC